MEQFKTPSVQINIARVADGRYVIYYLRDGVVITADVAKTQADVLATVQTHLDVSDCVPLREG